MWDTAKAVLKGKVIVLSTYIKKERYQINNPSFCVNKLEEEEQDKCKAKEERKTRAEIRSNMINVDPNMLISTFNVDSTNTTSKTKIFKLDIEKVRQKYMLLTRKIP